MKRLFIGLCSVLFLPLSPVLHAQDKSPEPLDFLLAGRLRPIAYSLSMVMVHDVVDPPAASRYYTYTLLGAYDLVSQRDPSIVGPGKVFPHYSPFGLTMDPRLYDYKIAAEYSVLEAGRAFLPSGYMMIDREKSFVELMEKHHVPRRIVDSSIAVAKALVAHVLDFAKGDHYNQLSAKLRYTPLVGAQYWYPTPPGYIQATEPDWWIIRPMIVDTCTPCQPIPPTPYSNDTASAFYHLGKAVYEQGNHHTAEQEDIANFWDCNPFNMQTSGHMMIGLKKISPGGHWMDIAANVSWRAGLNFDQSVALMDLVAAATMDSFIHCWTEKYRSNRVRPETFINRVIDPQWRPILQTPPFPEYPSAHSVISTAAAGVLTYFLGNHFAYTDSAEILFGVPPRSFTSFDQAASEAAISRFYGGIHYLDGVRGGQTQGRAVLARIVADLKQAGLQPFVQE